MYKWITKNPDIRTDPFAHKLFSPQQNSFIKSHNIVDGTLSLHEIMHHGHVKKWEGVMLKLDFERPMIRSIGISYLLSIEFVVLMTNGVCGLNKWTVIYTKRLYLK